jgi:hypothetical protein
VRFADHRLHNSLRADWRTLDDWSILD